MFSTYFARQGPNNFGCLTFLPCSSLSVKHDHWSTNICLTPDTSRLWCSLYINGWLLLHWRREKSIKTKDTLTWVQESKSLVVSTFSSPKPVVSWSRGRETRGSGRSRYLACGKPAVQPAYVSHIVWRKV